MAIKVQEPSETAPKQVRNSPVSLCCSPSSFFPSLLFLPFASISSLPFLLLSVLVIYLVFFPLFFLLLFSFLFYFHFVYYYCYYYSYCHYFLNWTFSRFFPTPKPSCFVVWVSWGHLLPNGAPWLAWKSQMASHIPNILNLVHRPKD